MGKSAKEKAALKAAKAAAKAEAKANKETENKKEEVKPQVDNIKKEEKKEDPTPKPTEKKAEEKKETPKATPVKEEKKDAPKSPKKPEKEKKDKTPTLIPEEVHDHDPNKKAISRAASLMNSVNSAGIPIGSVESSVDGKAMLAYVMQQRYANNMELKKQYPELYQELNRSIDVVTLLALVGVRQDLINRNERGELQLTIAADQILPLQGMADLLGIQLAPAKALPGADNGQMTINFSESKIPEELIDKNKPKEEEPELDPNKITNEDEIKEALGYLIRKEKNVARNIVNTVEWYRVLRGLKESDAEKKLALDERSVTDWINEILGLIQPAALLCGLGKAVYLYTSQTGSPCMAHSIMRKHMVDAGWSEEQVAEALRALVGVNFNNKLKDNPELKPEEDKAIKAVTGLLGNEYIDKLFADFNAKTEGVEDNKKLEIETAREVARKVIGTIRTNYFDKQGENPTLDKIRMVIGQIINLYRDPADRLAEYCQSELIVPKEGEYPEKKAEKKN